MSRKRNKLRSRVRVLEQQQSRRERRELAAANARVADLEQRLAAVQREINKVREQSGELGAFKVAVQRLLRSGFRGDNNYQIAVTWSPELLRMGMAYSRQTPAANYGMDPYNVRRELHYIAQEVAWKIEAAVCEQMRKDGMLI